MKNGGAPASKEAGAGRSGEHTQEHLARVGSLGRGVRGPHVQVRELRVHTQTGGSYQKPPTHTGELREVGPRGADGRKRREHTPVKGINGNFKISKSVHVYISTDLPPHLCAFWTLTPMIPAQATLI